MTSTLMARPRAKPKGLPRASQTTAVTAAMAMTAGTNTPETLSATLAMGAFVAAASSTREMICCKVVSAPTRVASHLRSPC